MENRERDRVSQRSSPTEAGELNRRVEEEKGREHNSGTSAEFGQKIGRSENLEGGNMRKGNDDLMTNIGGSSSGTEINEDSSRRSGKGSFDSSTGSGSMGGGSDRLRDQSDDETRDRIGNSSEGRH
jgi:hypothetical protein